MDGDGLAATILVVRVCVGQLDWLVGWCRQYCTALYVALYLSSFVYLLNTTSHRPFQLCICHLVLSSPVQPSPDLNVLILILIVIDLCHCSAHLDPDL